MRGRALHPDTHGGVRGHAALWSPRGGGREGWGPLSSSACWAGLRGRFWKHEPGCPGGHPEVGMGAGPGGPAQVRPCRGLWRGAACGWSGAPGRRGAGGAGATAGLGPGRGGRRARGPLPGPGWVGPRPPGPGREARPSVAATINMFVQGKPGREPCALARPGRKGRLSLAHWGDCSCSRNGRPVAGKVRRPSGPVGSDRCLGPLCSLPAGGRPVRIASGRGAGTEGARQRPSGGREEAECPAGAAGGPRGFAWPVRSSWTRAVPSVAFGCQGTQGEGGGQNRGA